MDAETVKARDWLTPHEVAERCGVSHSAVIAWVRRGRIIGGKPVRLPAGRMVKRYRIKAEDLARFLAQFETE